MMTWLIRLTVLVWLQQYLLARISEAEYALYPVIASVVAFAPLLTVVLTSGISRYITESWAKGDDDRIVRIVSTITPVLWGVALVVVAVGSIFSWYIDWVLEVDPAYVSDARLMALLMFFGLAFTLATAPFLAGLAVRQRFVLTNVLELSQELVRLGLLFGLLFGVGPRVLWVVASTVAATVIVRPLWMTLSMRAVPALRFRLWAFDRPLLGTLVGFGTWSFVGRVANAIRQMADPIILNKLATPFDVTCFYLGSLAPRQIELASSIARTPLTPVLTTAYAMGQTDRLRAIFLRGGRYSLWLNLAPVIPLMVLGREIWTLYVGEKFISAGVVLVLLVSPWFINSTLGMLAQLSEATGQVRELAWRGLAIQISNLALTLVLVGGLQMGAIGSAMATMLTGIVGGAVLIWPVAMRMARLRLSDVVRQALWPGLIPAAGTAAWMFGVKQLWGAPAGWTGVGVHTAAGLVVYIGLLVGVSLRPEDRADLRRVLERFGLTPSSKP